MKTLFFLSNSNIGDFGLSGGDRIFVELARRWRVRTKFTIIGAEEAISVCRREGLLDVDFIKISNKLSSKNVFTFKALLLNFIKKLTCGVFFAVNNKKLFSSAPYIYSASDFYPDSIPAFLIKFMNPGVTWIAGFYLFAPAPWQKDSPYKGRDIMRGILYWISQKPVYWLVNRYADVVFVTSEPDVKRFVNKKRTTSKVLAIRGGVDIRKATEYFNSGNTIPVEKRKYDACFVGRFHQQKGVVILIDIWKKVVGERPKAMLAMIGNGPLEEDVLEKVKRLGIEGNVRFFGFLDGEEKFNIFKQSKIILHPAIFDSGGMAAAEAMAWGLPSVSFDLEALKTYYPRGMSKVLLGDQKAFAGEILKFLTDKGYYERMSGEARGLIVEEWDWDKRADLIYKKALGGI